MTKISADGSTPSGARPAVSGVVANGPGTLTLTGTQLTGIPEGAFYGDDAGMSENYPLVRLTAPSGTVFCARAFDWSTTALATGQAVETTEFALPAGIAARNDRLSVAAAGISSKSFHFTVGNH